MKKKTSNRNVVFLGTSLPRECGIATFTQDLLNEFEHMEGFNKPQIIAINNNQTYPYTEQVIREINQHQLSDYIDTADYLNASDTDLLVIQHEFGIYGGESGEYLLRFVESLQIPYIVIFHTVLRKPSVKQRHIMNRVGAGSVKVVTMAQSTVKDLTTVYGIDATKVACIHHGVPYVKTDSRSQLKEQNGYANRKFYPPLVF